ncbi:hypothetical protein SB766_17575 [Pseudomonas sp. SIMBA_077]
MKPITLYVFVHDTVTLSSNVIGRQYIKDFTDEITAITGRSFVFHMLRNIPGLTDMNYKAENPRDAIDRWTALALDYRNTRNLEWTSTERYILVINDTINEKVLGGAYERRPAVIASVSSYQVIAHEVGHSFTATHEDAELGWNPWGVVCETYLYPEIIKGRANCYRYTKKNRERIVNYLKDAP